MSNKKTSTHSKTKRKTNIYKNGQSVLYNYGNRGTDLEGKIFNINCINPTYDIEFKDDKGKDYPVYNISEELIKPIPLPPINKKTSKQKLIEEIDKQVDKALDKKDEKLATELLLKKFNMKEGGKKNKTSKRKRQNKSKTNKRKTNKRR